MWGLVGKTLDVSVRDRALGIIAIRSTSELLWTNPR